MFERFPLVVEAPGDEATLTRSAHVAAQHWGLAEPELIRVGANGVFVSGDVIVRVSKATAPMSAALQFARCLQAEGIRAAIPARDDWIELDNGLNVTAWERIEHDPDRAVDWEFVGGIVARVHALDPTTVDHPLPFCATFPWWDFDQMFDEASTIDELARDGLRSAYETHRWWIDAARGGPLVLCHGDVHPGNVLVDATGPVLIDWDLLCVGPRAWDHAPLMTWTARWGGDAGVYEAFRSGYGRRVDDELGSAIAEMRLIAATLMRLKRARFDPAHADEAFRRLAYWRGDPDPPMWQAQ